MRAEIEVHGGGEIVHRVNGETVLRYEKPQMGGGAVAGHDPALKRDGEILTSGSISLQAESHPVEFRKVELLNLVGCQDKKAKNYKSYFEKDDPRPAATTDAARPGIELLHVNRKEFLTLVGGSALFAATASALEVVTAEAAPPGRKPVLGPAQRATLKALADEIIPAADGMPSAGEMGAAAYLERAAQRDEGVASALRDALASIEQRARARHRRSLRAPPGGHARGSPPGDGEGRRSTNSGPRGISSTRRTTRTRWSGSASATTSSRPTAPGRRSSRSRKRCSSASAAMPRLYRAVP